MQCLHLLFLSCFQHLECLLDCSKTTAKMHHYRAHEEGAQHCSVWSGEWCGWWVVSFQGFMQMVAVVLRSHLTACQVNSRLHLHVSRLFQSDGHCATALLAGSSDLTELHNNGLAAAPGVLTLCAEEGPPGSLVSMGKLAGSTALDSACDFGL